MEQLELTCFQIISCVGTARSLYIEAIKEMKQGNIKKSEQCIEEGIVHFAEGHKAHASMIQEEAEGKTINTSLLLMHAEDQLMCAEGFKIVALEFIDLYKTLADQKVISFK